MDWRDRRIAELEQELAARDQLIAEQAAEIAELKSQVAALMARLDQDSHNSNLPPSSDSPRARAGRRGSKGRKPRKRKRGGQPGHKGSKRELLPPEQVDEFVDLFPPECENCWEGLPKTPDPLARRHQVTELPPITPHTTEYRRHAVTCPECDYKTRAAYDENVIPASPFGPRLMSVVALLTGFYHLSRRKTVELLQDIVGARISLGAVSAVEERVSETVEPVVQEAWQRVRDAPVKHADGTSWLQAGKSLSLWTLATTVATVFKIVIDGSKQTLKPLFGRLRGILHSDRAKALNFWAMERRQICWAHLIRKFISFAERSGPTAEIGNELLGYAGIVFEYWDDYKTAKLTREVFVSWMRPVRQQFEALLERAAAAGIRRLSGSCADILEHRMALWNFVDRQDVEPTNNHAERELRAFVLWRRRSFGTQSERGNRFAERLMTIAHTARKQNRNVLAFLTDCMTARGAGAPMPSLFETPLAAAA